MKMYLTTKRAEAEGIKETPFTNFTSVGDTFTRPRLRPLIQEHNPSTVDYVGLNSTDVQHLLKFIHPNHIMIGRPPNLLNSKQKRIKQSFILHY